jgi:hypothetical protein
LPIKTELPLAAALVLLPLWLYCRSGFAAVLDVPPFDISFRDY